MKNTDHEYCSNYTRGNHTHFRCVHSHVSSSAFQKKILSFSSGKSYTAIFKLSVKVIWDVYDRIHDLSKLPTFCSAAKFSISDKKFLRLRVKEK